MNKTFVVARWEYLEKVKSKAFLIGLFLTPMIMIGMGVLPGLLAEKEDEETKVIGVIDVRGEIAPLLAKRMERYRLSNGQPNYLLLPVRATAADIAASVREADERVERGEFDGYIVLNAPEAPDTVIRYFSKGAGDLRLIGRLEENIQAIYWERTLIARGIDPGIVSAMKPRVEVKSVKIGPTGEREETNFLKTFFSAYVFIMAMFFLIFTSGQLLVRSVLEEKSNRIIEVLVSSCTPSELMAGKVLGLSAMGLTQVGFWAIVALAIFARVGTHVLPPVEQLLLMVVYFVLGYLFYSAIFIAFGSPVTTEQEAQQLNGYLVLFVILPVALVLPVMQHPDAGWVKVLTFIPLLTPTFMALRIPVQMPSAVEIVGSVVLLAVFTYVMMIVAGRIFRVAILATGKRPSLAELVRWVKEG